MQISVRADLLSFSTILLVIFFLSCNSKPSIKFNSHPAKKNIFTVAFLPYSNFDTGLANFVQNQTAKFYNCSVIILKPATLPATAYYAPRNRYKADILLSHQKNIIPKNIDALVGLTDKDISTANGKIADWGVFGLGMCPGNVCIISSYRLKRASNTKNQLEERLIKVVLHEVGHNLGLPHCTSNIKCLMTDAGGTINQVDKEKKWLCESCKSILSN